VHGKSFLPVLNAETDKHRKAVIMGYYEGVDRCVRDSLWSYVQRPEGEPDELYNLNEDPKETVNLVDKRPEEAQRLSSLFGQHYRRLQTKTVKGVQGRYELASGTTE
jgi:arylsulfatase A-like enzyme